ncbi:Crp/Fnr family transcriptional regulator [Sphingomonas oligophenolica]|uniref:Crp/Fnr family transcriptional regulator n=1 Tax=Sphingomonas oligophenolica TaxID=301154 RepID=UPI0014768115|nr:Crp/Fnr family transcriptional regulator [Sphingomonas oligophenolica]
MITYRFLAGRGRDRMSRAELVTLDSAMSRTRTVDPRTAIVRRGEYINVSTYLISGYICRYMDDREGHRQLVALHVPGDFVDLHAFPMKRLDHDVASLGPVEIGTYEHETLARIGTDSPHLTRMLWYSTLLDAAMHREWIFRLGRLGAVGRVAHFFCEIDARLAMVGLSEDHRFTLPLTQADLAEATGLTGVHVNRTLRRLREDGLMSFRHGAVEIADPVRLARLAEFDPDYLYGDPPAAQER